MTRENPGGRRRGAAERAAPLQSRSRRLPRSPRARKRRRSRDRRRGGRARSASSSTGCCPASPASSSAAGCAARRRPRRIPIIMLTARGEEERPRARPRDRRRRLCGQAVLDARAHGAHQGAAAPRQPELRRRRAQASATSSSTARRTASRRAGREVHLGPTEFRLLEFLMQSPAASSRARSCSTASGATTSTSTSAPSTSMSAACARRSTAAASRIRSAPCAAPATPSTSASHRRRAQCRRSDEAGEPHDRFSCRHPLRPDRSSPNGEGGGKGLQTTDRASPLSRLGFASPPSIHDGVAGLALRARRRVGYRSRLVFFFDKEVLDVLSPVLENSCHGIGGMFAKAPAFASIFRVPFRPARNRRPR